MKLLGMTIELLAFVVPLNVVFVLRSNFSLINPTLIKHGEQR